jgi:glucose-1-phosphate cytidylyltransferase
MTTPVVVLAGGLGTRLREETSIRPKPMIEIGARPILWHIMKIYDHFGFQDFVIPVGYKGHLIKEYFLGYNDRYTDFTIDLASGRLIRHSNGAEHWSVSVVDTGMDTMTGGRIKRVSSFLSGRFMVTYGDGVADLDIVQLIRFHESHGRLATVTAVRPPARFGALHLNRDRVTAFAEKPQSESGWINGGFFVFERAVLDYIEGDDTALEHEPLERLAAEGQLAAYRHPGFWEPMDTQRDLDSLNRQWASGAAPWKVWDG